ncbi:hypothetical protein lbkm_0024 [Lachnospiraceae bacterium KM106-2]|nr:hypothetical protein lbkm_0024 [Lachnospiraceae bacterium KM106-2]
MVKETIEECESHTKRKRFKLPRVAVAAIAICVLAGSGIGTTAAVKYFKTEAHCLKYPEERMKKVPKEKKDKYVEDLQEAPVDCDFYSREFTKKEDARMEVLTKKYESKKLYPKGSLLQIKSKKEVDPDKVCFLAKISTFYLPERKLTDEELLQVIDFYYTRDYSLNEQYDAHGAN